MNANYVFALAIGIGVVAGLRSMAAPALVAWAAQLGWLNLHGSSLVFMASRVTVAIFSLGALAEIINDKLPKTPSRTSAGALIARLLTGGLSGSCLCVAAGQSLVTGAVLGAVGALIGTFGGYQVRTRLVRALGVKDIFVAVPEDVVAIGLAYLFCSRF